MRQQLQSSWGFFLEGVEDNKTELINHIYDVFNSIRAQLEGTNPTFTFRPL